MNDNEDSLERLGGSLEGVPIPEPDFETIRRRARTLKVRRYASITLLSALIAAGIILPLKALLPLGDRDKGGTQIGGQPSDVASSPCDGLPCVAFGSFPVGALASCPAIVPDAQEIDRPGLIREIALVADEGSFPWEMVDPATQGLFGTEQRYRELVAGRPFDVAIMSIGDPANPPALRDPIARACGEEVAGSFQGVRVDATRGDVSQSFYLVFVPTEDGQALLWLTLDPDSIEPSASASCTPDALAAVSTELTKVNQDIRQTAARIDSLKSSSPNWEYLNAQLSNLYERSAFLRGALDGCTGSPSPSFEPEPTAASDRVAPRDADGLPLKGEALADYLGLQLIPEPEECDDWLTVDGETGYGYCLEDVDGDTTWEARELALRLLGEDISAETHAELVRESSIAGADSTRG